MSKIIWNSQFIACNPLILLGGVRYSKNRLSLFQRCCPKAMCPPFMGLLAIKEPFPAPIQAFSRPWFLRHTHLNACGSEMLSKKNRFWTRVKPSIKTGESKLWIYESIGLSLSCVDTLVLLRQHLIRKSPLYDFFYLLRPSSQTSPTWFFEMQKVNRSGMCILKPCPTARSCTIGNISWSFLSSQANLAFQCQTGMGKERNQRMDT